MVTPEKQENTDIREEILDAAESRFGHYGYNKTTMVEIAEDTGMSAANLYRYFENKQEIIAACANRCICNRIDQLRAATRIPDQTATDMLKNYVLTTLQFTHELASDNQKISELVEMITEHRPDLIHERIDAEILVLSEILSYGNKTGEFEVEDITTTAKSIHASLIMFDVPIFMHLYSLDEFKERAHSIIQLLINGLSKK